MSEPSLVVIGASWGGVDALTTLLRKIPKGFLAPIAVVQHRAEDTDSLLAQVLQRSTELKVEEAEDKGELQPGHVYLAPAGYHLLIDEGALSLSVDERENFARPSVDVLFESAAEWFRNRVVAIVLTGVGRDGARGAQVVEELGGMVIVEDPQTAVRPEMPSAALASTHKAHVYPVQRIPTVLSRLCAKKRARAK